MRVCSGTSCPSLRAARYAWVIPTPGPMRASAHIAPCKLNMREILLYLACAANSSMHGSATLLRRLIFISPGGWLDATLAESLAAFLFYFS